MIPVSVWPEPADFDAKVRTPGRSFLKAHPKPTSNQFKTNNFWKHCLQDLRAAYNSICAYSACWIPTDYTVDHFLPRTYYPRLAYEWDNYRLSCARINQKKGDKIGILDPFSIKPGWFVLDCASFYVHPGEALQMALVGQIRYTIDTLDLNCDSLVEMRFNVTRDYSQGNINLVFLQSRYPFVGLELQRQNLVRTIIGAIK